MKHVVGIIALLQALTIWVIAVGCTSPHRQAGHDEAAHTDSIASEEATTEVPLPDTTYGSAARIQPAISVFDTITSGTIDSYADPYDAVPGIFTFRGNQERSAPYVGKLDGTPDSLVTVWKFYTSMDLRATNHGTWGGGTGWTGQPLYVEWPDTMAESFRNDTLACATLPSNREVIFASLDGNVYFLDFETGRPSRDTISVSNPIKGTPMLDPLHWSRLYVGHGLLADRAHGWGQLTIDLQRHRIIHRLLDDSRAWRSWHANDASPLRVGQFVFNVSENGTIYKWLVTPEGRRLHSSMQYRIDDSVGSGFEASMSAWRNYGYVNDNHGNLVCVNLDNLRPVWRYDLGDDCDCTPVVCHEEDGTFVYAGCEVDRHPSDSLCRFVKLDALRGDTIWTLQTVSARCNKEGKHFDGGYYASSLPGRGNCADLIFNNRVRNLEGQNGELVAIDRRTGQERYVAPLRHYAWSSPVGFLNERDEFFVLTFDTVGRCYIFDGSSGRILYSRIVGGNFESSPIVIGDEVVVGSRDGFMYKFRVTTNHY